MTKPYKTFHVRLALSDRPRYQFMVSIFEAKQPGVDKEYLLGKQYFSAQEASDAVGDLVEGIMGEYTDFDPVFVMYRDRTGEARDIPKRRWSHLWGWIEEGA